MSGYHLPYEICPHATNHNHKNATTKHANDHVALVAGDIQHENDWYWQDGHDGLREGIQDRSSKQGGAMINASASENGRPCPHSLDRACHLLV